MSKTLIAFFSHAGQNYFEGSYRYIKKGNTKVVAEKLKALTGADLFEIETVKTYSDDYKTCCDQAMAEQQNGELPELKNLLESIDDYEAIILCYPCWWGTAPQAVFSFLKHYDFSDKKILPLCTHEGSGMGRSERDIRLVCPKTPVERGLAIQGSYVESCDKALKAWLNI